MAARARTSNHINSLEQRKYNKRRASDRSLPPFEKGWKTVWSMKHCKNA